MALPETGMRAVLENADGFERDAKKVEDAYLRIAEAEMLIAKTSPQAAALMGLLGDALVDAGIDAEKLADLMEEAAEAIGGAADETTSSLENMSKIMSAGVIQKFAAGAGRAGDVILDFAKDSAFTAARVEELYVVLENLAEQSGVNAGEVRQQVDAIKELGITTDVSANLVSQFVRSNLDLTKASELARLAQDAAVISMEDSSQALAGLLHGILTLQPELLRYRGIIVDFQSEYKKWADANDRTVLSLTSAEKQTIALNAVLAQGESIAGTYEAAMDTASKQMRSFNRYVLELKEDFGNALLPVLKEGVFTAKDLVKEIQGLPEPMKAAIASSGALTGALLKGTSSAIGFGAQVGELAVAMKELEIAANLPALAILGPAGLAIGLAAIVGIGVASAIKAQEDAHRKEAAAILDSTETYNDYVRKARDAELGSYALSESLFDIAKGANAAADGLSAMELTEAFRDLDMAIGGAPTGIKAIDEALISINDTSDLTEEKLTRIISSDFLESLSDAELLVLQDADSVRKLGENAGYTGDQLNLYVQILTDAATIQAAFNDAAEDTGGLMLDVAEATYDATKAQVGYSDAVLKGGSEFNKYQEKQIEKMLERNRLIIQTREEEGKTIYEIVGLQNKLAEAEEEAGEVGEKALEDLTDAEEKAASKRQDLRSKMLEDLGELEKDHAEEITEILEEMAETDKELQEELLEVARDSDQERLEAAEELARALEELDRKTAEERADLQRDLNRDLQGIERDHLRTLEELERDYYAQLEKLAEEYGDRLSDINRKFADERKSILEKYRIDDEGPDIDEQRRSIIEEIRRLQELQREGRTGIDYTQDIESLKKKLQELQKLELEELEKRKQGELDELEKWRKEREDAEKDGYEKERENEKIAYEERRQERIRQHQERLQDLEIELQREREAIARSNAQKLAELDKQLAEERQRLQSQAREQQERLRQQLEEEQRSYAERYTELTAHYGKQQAEIDRAFDEQLKTIDTSANEQIQALAKAYGIEQSDLEKHLGDMLGAWQRYIIAVEKILGIHSPSKWTENLSTQMIAGFDRADFEGALTGVVSNLKRIAAPSLPVVPRTQGGDVTNTKNNYINYTGQAYDVGSIESALRLTEVRTGG